jgi:hypothetical protein
MLDVETTGICCDFQGWFDGNDQFITDTVPYGFQLAENTTVKARCEGLGPFELKVNQVNAATGAPFADPTLVTLDPPPTGGMYDCCTWVTAVATDVLPFEFLGWSADFDLAVTDTVELEEFHMIQNREITATFWQHADQYTVTVTSEPVLGRDGCYSVEVTGVMTEGVVALGETKDFVAQVGAQVTLQAVNGGCCAFAGGGRMAGFCRRIWSTRSTWLVLLT